MGHKLIYNRCYLTTVKSFRHCNSSFNFPRELGAVGQAMVNASMELKAAMTKAVLTALSGFNDMMNNMEVKMKTLLQKRVHVGTLIKHTLSISIVNSEILVYYFFLRYAVGSLRLL